MRILGTLKQIDALCPVEKNQEAWAAQLIVTKLAELKEALELASKVVVTNDGSDCINGMIDAIGDSGIHGWISGCRAAGLFTTIKQVAA